MNPATSVPAPTSSSHYHRCDNPSSLYPLRRPFQDLHLRAGAATFIVAANAICRRKAAAATPVGRRVSTTSGDESERKSAAAHAVHDAINPFG